MSSIRSRDPVALAAVLALLLSLLPLASARAGDGAGGGGAPEHASRTYTTDADFGEGSQINLVAEDDRLRLDDTVRAFDFIWVAVSSAGTIVKIDTKTGEVLGEYRTAPQGQPTNPSRTTVDQDGNVWAGNRNGSSVVKVGLLENGQCEDRDGNGEIETSTGLGDVLAWPNTGGADTAGGVSTAADECITHYVRVNSSGTRHVSVDADNNVWVSGTGGRRFDLVDGQTGEILRAEPSVNFGGYGGLIDPDGVIWSARRLLRWDTANPLTGPSGGNWQGYTHDSYGLCIDSDGNVWNTQLSGNRVRKFAPDGTELGSFPHGFNNAQGCVVDGNGDVWVAHSILGGGNSVGRLRNDGTFVGRVPVGSGPTGVAVDGDGKVWATNHNSRTVSRIDPDAGPMGDDGAGPVGAVDLVTENLGGSLYNYSDMTGSTLSGAPRTGTWTVVYDSEIDGAGWGSIDWLAELSGDARLSVSAASSTDGTSFTSSVEVTNGGELEIADGRYLRIVASFTRSADGDSPVLDELTVRTAGALGGPLPVAGGPYTVPEGGAVFLTGSADPGLDQRPVEFAWDLDGDGTFETPGPNPRFDASALDGPSVVEVTLEACYAGGGCDTDTATVEVLNVPPEVDAGPDLHARPGEEVVLDGRFADPAGDADAPFTAAWTVEDDTFETVVDHAEPVLREVTFDEPGSYVAGLSVTDADGGTGSDELRVEVAAVDPECGGAGPTLDELWPPDHRVLVAVGVTGVTHPAGDDVEVTITGIRQDEPVDSIGDGSFAPDGFGVGTSTAQLRAERQGGGSGRFYHVFFEATTEAGGSCEGVVRVVVPHDRSPQHVPVDDGPLYDSTVAVDPEPGSAAAPDGRDEEAQAPGVLADDLHPDGAGLYVPDREVWTGEDTPVEFSLFARGDGAEDATFALTAAPASGSAVLDGAIVTYTPGADFHGEDLLTYEAASGDTTSNPGVVRLVVTPSNDTPVAGDAAAEVAEDGTVLVDVLAHAGDADGDPLEVVHLTAPESGAAGIEDGQVRYTPEPDYFGPDRFRYRVADPDGAVAAAWVHVTVTEVNDPPVASDVFFTIDWDDGLLQVPAEDLTADDLPGPPNEVGQTLTVTGVEETGDTHGTVELGAGVVTWTPDDELFVGVAHFRYEVCDDGTTAGEPDPRCALGNVFVTVEEVNRPPVALDQEVTTAEDSWVEVTLAGSDVNDDPLTFAVVDPPQHGTVVGLPPVVTYTPDADYFGPDAFTFVANDGEFDSDPATVSVTVTEVNDPPVTSDVFYTLLWGEMELVVPAQEFAANDVPGPANESDQTLTVAGVEATPGTHGTLEFDEGIVTYTPDEGFEGDASFAYEVCDDGTTAGEPDPLCATGTVVVDVAGPPPPEAGDVEVTVAEDSQVTVDVTANDTHPDGLLFSVVEVSDPANGVAAVVTMGPDEGSVFYKPDDDYFGPDQFTYTVEDTRGGRASATVFVTVTEVNDPPVTADVHYTITWLEVLEVPAADLAANDVPGPPNESDQTLTVTAVEATAGTHGTVELDGGVVTYTPEPGFSGEASFDYEVCDDGTTAGEPDPLCASGEVFVTVEAVNRPPVALDQHVTTTEGVPVEITLEATDPDGDTLAYLLASVPEHGALFGTPPALTYEPEAGFTGTDAFQFLANDGELDSNLATVTVEVEAATVATLHVAPASITLEPGQDWPFTATATFDTGDSADVTSEAAWSSSDEAVATVDATGLVTAVADGEATVTAAFGGHDATATVLVESVDLDEIVVELPTGTLLVGETMELTAVGVRADGTSVSLTAEAVWASDDETVATLSGTDPVVVTLVGDGTATITATVAGVAGSATVTAVAPVDDDVPAVAEIASPQPGDELTGPAPVTGTADDDNLLKWVLDYAPAGETGFTLLAEGTDAVLDGEFAAFDPTTLLNDLYTLRLRAYDLGGNVTTDTVVVQVAGDQKVGNFSIAYQDLSVPLSGMALEVTRVYDSRDRRAGDFGFGWSLDLKTTRVRTDGAHGTGWQMTSSGGLIPVYSIVPTRPHLATITLPDGHVEEFDMQPVPSSQQVLPPQFVSATYNARPGTRGTLQPLGNVDLIVAGSFNDLQLLDDQDVSVYDPREFLYTSETGERFQIHVAQGVRAIQDPNGNTISISAGGIVHSSGEGVGFTRDAEGRITSITDPAGNTQTYTYDTNGDLAAHTDALGNVTTFRYNRHHGLLEVVDPLGNRGTRQEYDEAGRLVAIVDAHGNRMEFDSDLDARTEVVTDRNGGVTVLAYDERGNVTSETDPTGATRNFTFDADDRLASETDPVGRTTSYTYDAGGNLLTSTDHAGAATAYTYNARGQAETITDALGHTSIEDYDASGNLLSSSDPTGATTAYAYGAGGNITSMTLPDGCVVSLSYDARGNLTSMVDALGTTGSYTYDDLGNLTSETVERTLPGGGAETLVTAHTYDAAGRRTATTHPDGATTSTEYDAAGRVVAEVDELGRRTEFSYDSAGRLVATAFPDGTSDTATYDGEGQRLSVTDRGGRTTSFAYDLAGRLVSVTHPDGATETRSYDAAGQLVTETDALGATTTHAYDGAGNRVETVGPGGATTTWTYDLMGRVETMTDPLGGVTTVEHDEAGRPTLVTHPDGTTTAMAYDDAGRLVSETDGAGVSTTLAYDCLGRLVQAADGLGNTTVHTYDEVGNRVAQTDALGRVTGFEYDARGRLTARHLPLGQTEEFAHDAAGNVVEHTAFGGEAVTLAYDAADRLVERALPGGDTVALAYTAGGERATVTDARGTTTYAYDARGRLASVTDPHGEEVTYGWDAAGNRTLVGTSAGDVAYDYDAAGRLVEVAEPGGQTTTATYDLAGNRTSLTYPNGVETTYAYDAGHRLQRLTTTGAGGSEVADYVLAYTPAGQVSTVVEGSGRTVGYAYDAGGRLTGETVDAGGAGVRQTGWTYDAAGNRLTETVDGVETAYAYDDNDRLLSAGAVTYGYDAAGNRVEETRGDGTELAYDYDALNRLSGVTTTPAGGSASTVAYAYDVDGNRVASTSGGAQRRYVLDTAGEHAQVLLETDGAGDVLAHHLRAGALLATFAGGDASYVHHDWQESTRALTDAAGAVSDRYEYGAFGAPEHVTGSSPNPYLFTGEAYDAPTGLYHLRARYYDAVTGRFTAQDPHPGLLDEPRTVNRYVYSWNDPVNLRDPSGELPTVGAQLAAINMRAQLFIASVPWRLASAFGTGGAAVGRLWNTLGLMSQRFAAQVLHLHPRMVLDASTRVGSRFVDLAPRVGNLRALIEVKYSLPARAGPALNRLVGQVNAAVASNRGQVVLFTLRSPRSTAEVARVMNAIGSNASRVQFVHGTQGLFNWMRLYFGPF